MNNSSFSDLTSLALVVRDRYSELQKADGHKQWNAQDRMAGFVGDVGDLSKLIMAKHGIRRGPDDIDAALAHELSDCLWSVMVLADELDIDLEQAFTKTMRELQARIARRPKHDYFKKYKEILLMDRQYKPLHYTIDNFPVIVYVTKDESPVTDVLPTQTEVKAYIESLIVENPNIRTGEYAVIFVWNNRDKEMADVWMMGENTESNSGPLLECFAFAGKEQSVSGDIASGDTIIALAAEEQKRRQFDTLALYLSDDSPAPFPEGMTPQEEYPQ